MIGKLAQCSIFSIRKRIFYGTFRRLHLLRISRRFRSFFAASKQEKHDCQHTQSRQTDESRPQDQIRLAVFARKLFRSFGRDPRNTFLDGSRTFLRSTFFRRRFFRFLRLRSGCGPLLFYRPGNSGFGSRCIFYGLFNRSDRIFIRSIGIGRLLRILFLSCENGSHAAGSLPGKCHEFLSDPLFRDRRRFLSILDSRSIRSRFRSRTCLRFALFIRRSFFAGLGSRTLLFLQKTAECRTPPLQLISKTGAFFFLFSIRARFLKDFLPCRTFLGGSGLFFLFRRPRGSRLHRNIFTFRFPRSLRLRFGFPLGHMVSVDFRAVILRLFVFFLYIIGVLIRIYKLRTVQFFLIAVLVVFVIFVLIVPGIIVQIGIAIPFPAFVSIFFTHGPTPLRFPQYAVWHFWILDSAQLLLRPPRSAFCSRSDKTAFRETHL